MKMSRSERREKLVKALYALDMNGDPEMSDFNDEMTQAYEDVKKNLDDIDAIISDHLVNWTLDRLNLVDKAIVRFAVYEMKYTDIPAEIAIDEALNLTKTYSNLDDDKARKFNNKLLDTIKKGIDGDNG
jgi:N utilization substance protein B